MGGGPFAPVSIRTGSVLLPVPASPLILGTSVIVTIVIITPIRVSFSLH